MIGGSRKTYVSTQSRKKAINNEVLLFFNPITTVSGKVLSEVPTPRGSVVVSAAACSRQASRLILLSWLLKLLVVVFIAIRSFGVKMHASSSLRGG